MQASVAADHVHSSDHNLDIDGYRKSLPNVDYSRTHLNEVLVAEPLEDLYEREFGAALEAYNARQRRKDRRIESYYDKISESDQEKLCYEVIVQIGDRDNNPAVDDVNREKSGEVYREYLDRFQEKYGHVLKVFEAAIHYDEATPHMHLSFVPVVENRGRNGLAVKNSFRQAMQELGISNGRAIEFYHGAHEMLAQVMEDHGIEKTSSRYDRANRGDMTQEEYAEFSRNQEKLIESREELASVRQEVESAKSLAETYTKVANQLDDLVERRSTEAEEMRIEIEALKGERSSLEAKVGALKVERADLNAEVTELNIQVTSLRRERNALEAAVERLREVADRIIERIRPYLPNPILALARAIRDENEWGRERWHEAMEDTAIDLIEELPSRLEEEMEWAAAASRDALEYGFDSRDKNVKRDEWSI